MLLIIFNYDIVYASRKLKILQFANDTTIFIQGQNINEIIYTLNDELIKVTDWIKNNKLMLNITKTFCILLSGKNIHLQDMNIKIDNNLLSKEG